MTVRFEGPRRKVGDVAISREELTEKLETLVRAASALRNLTPRDSNTSVAIQRIEAEIDSARLILGLGTGAHAAI